MELFYCKDLAQMPGSTGTLSEEESAHCAKVLRHKEGDRINVIDGRGGLYDCVLTSVSPKACVFTAESMTEGWGGHGYRLEIACAPTKNADRYEWFAEKAAEIGVDSIVPLVCRHSERKSLRLDRLQKVLLSAAKQSLKGYVPEAAECTPFMEYIGRMSGSDSEKGLRMIAYCFPGNKVSMFSAVREYLASGCGDRPRITVLIGPEGDFSPEEVQAAMDAGFVPVVMGESRLRTETAAVVAAAAVYSAI